MEYKLKKFKQAITVSRIANIHYFEFANNYHTESDKHPFRELIYVDSGELIVQSEGFSDKLCENQMIIHKALEPHSLCCTEGTAPSVIIIGFECLSHELDRFSAEPVTLSTPLQRVLTEIIRESRTVFLPPYDLPGTKDMKKRADYPFGADQMIKIKLESLLISLIRGEATDSSVDSDSSGEGIAKVYAYIKENYCQSINLDELCFLYGTNKTTLCKSFKEAYGCTIINFINERRIKHAKELMRSGKFSITEISQLSGFSSVHYFSRVFKKLERLSPTDYMKTIKSKLGI